MMLDLKINGMDNIKRITVWQLPLGLLFWRVKYENTYKSFPASHSIVIREYPIERVFLFMRVMKSVNVLIRNCFPLLRVDQCAFTCSSAATWMNSNDCCKMYNAYVGKLMYFNVLNAE